MMNCLIAGVGGQGTVLASKLLAETALAKGLEARTSETIGMAQRGGSVVSHVRIGASAHSPLIPLGQADVLIALEPAEAVRALPYLRPDGAVYLCDTPIQPPVGDPAGYDAAPLLDYLRRVVPRLTIVDGKAVARHCGSVKALNVAMLGAAVSGAAEATSSAHREEPAGTLVGSGDTPGGGFPFTLDDVEAVIRRRIPGKFLDINLKALRFQEGR